MHGESEDEGVCVHGEREDEGVEYLCMGTGRIQKG